MKQASIRALRKPPLLYSPRSEASARHETSLMKRKPGFIIKDWRRLVGSCQELHLPYCQADYGSTGNICLPPRPPKPRRTSTPTLPTTSLSNSPSPTTRKPSRSLLCHDPAVLLLSKPLPSPSSTRADPLFSSSEDNPDSPPLQNCKINLLNFNPHGLLFEACMWVKKLKSNMTRFCVQIRTRRSSFHLRCTTNLEETSRKLEGFG
ncbi:uncharacterized protein LOC129354480 isoform X2 [Poeciliopsis prolifica]|uniref:uncharacterized protein LOC129354480 isoform X2 n=1 Tax=Poeciliopsis prolifica TaxID=188132 RepID=UPI0024143BAE|nr:uncharacterized protein LOC129354480 isoform X2 [Poeciliopsis prolifica]